MICRRFVELCADPVAIGCLLLELGRTCSVPRQCPRTSLGSDSPWMSTAEESTFVYRRRRRSQDLPSERSFDALWAYCSSVQEAPDLEDGPDNDVRVLFIGARSCS